MERDYDCKAQFHNHPHFYGPGGHRAFIPGERAYKFFLKVPSLLDIVNSSLEKDFSIVTISGCQSHIREVDKSVEYYFRQLDSLPNDFKIEDHLDEGFVKLSQGEKDLILLSGCEIRTNYNGLPADVNVIGISPKTYIEPEKDIDYTLEQAKDLGALVTACHPTSGIASMGIEKALELYEAGLIHSIEGFNAMATPGENKELAESLRQLGIKGIAVSDAHHYQDISRAYTNLPSGFERNFSRESLIDLINEGNFENTEGQISLWRNFVTHKFPILLSIPMNLIKNPRYFLNFLNIIKKE